MSNWSPLMGSIIHSTIWSESKEVRILWITMLAMKDREGMVWSSTIGLSRAASLTLEETKSGLKVLQSPDKKSEEHQEFEGRRIEPREGGWQILNHHKYQKLISEMRHREQQRKWQAGYRNRKKDKPLPGELNHERMAKQGASEGDLNRHVDSFTPLKRSEEPVEDEVFE